MAHPSCSMDMARWQMLARKEILLRRLEAGEAPFAPGKDLWGVHRLKHADGIMRTVQGHRLTLE
jgi:hypothetical protein